MILTHSFQNLRFMRGSRAIAATLFLALLSICPLLHAQGTAFTYQGRLMESNAPANGSFEFEFSLYDAATGGTNLGTLTLEETPVVNGLFAVLLDFGPGKFNGQPRWLEIYARNDGAGGAGVVLTPRQMITAAPYAMVAGHAITAATATNLAGLIASNQLADGAVIGAKIQNGSIVNAHISPSAAIADTKLGTIATAGKVANSATTATSANSSNTIVLRNAFGSFTANAIEAKVGFIGNGSDLTGLDADSIQHGTLDTARLPSSVTLLGNTIEPSELAKPYQSGRLSVSNKAELSFLRVPFQVSFNPPFATPPVVTLGLQLNDQATDDQYRATLVSVTTTGFTAAVYTPAPETYPGLYPSGYGEGIADMVAVSNYFGVAIAQQFGSDTTNLNFAWQPTTPSISFWTNVTIVTNRQVRGPLSAATVSGNPALTYFDIPLNQYRYVRAANALGTSWGSPVSIGGPSNAHMSPLILVAGRPAMAYVDNTFGFSGQLRFLRANDSTGASWPAAGVIVTNVAGYRPSLALIGGMPAIAFFDYARNRLSFTIASNAAGTAWSPAVTVHCCQFSSPNVTLIDAGGIPAVLYNEENGASQRVVYRRADDAQGTNWSSAGYTPLEYSGYLPALGVCDGRPFALWNGVSYEQGLRYSQGLDAAGTQWTRNVNLNTEAVGGDIVARVIHGRLTVLNLQSSQLVLLQPFPDFNLNWSAIAP